MDGQTTDPTNPAVNPNPAPVVPGQAPMPGQPVPTSELPVTDAPSTPVGETPAPVVPGEEQMPEENPVTPPTA